MAEGLVSSGAGSRVDTMWGSMASAESHRQRMAHLEGKHGHNHLDNSTKA